MSCIAHSWLIHFELCEDWGFRLCNLITWWEFGLTGGFVVVITNIRVMGDWFYLIFCSMLWVDLWNMWSKKVLDHYGLHKGYVFK